MPFGLGLPELLIILVVLLLVFGAKRLPEMGRSLGKGMREFKDGISGNDEAEATQAPTAPPPAAEAPAPAAPAAPAELPAAPVEVPAAPAQPTAERVEAEQGERERVS